MFDSYMENPEEPLVEEQKDNTEEVRYDLSEYSILSRDSETIVRSSEDGRLY
jgi:hypothetical protein